MKKNFMKGMTMLFAGMAFVACSHDVTVNEDYAMENVKAQYKAAFEQKYGKIDPNQSWDFTAQAVSGARTRGNEPYTKEMAQEAYNFFSFVNTDYKAVKELLTSDSYSYTYGSGRNKKTVNGSASNKDWNNFFSAKLTPTYAYIKNQNVTSVYRYYHIGFTYDNIEPIEMISNINVVGRSYDYWYDAKSGSLNHHTTRKIDTTPAISASNVRWCAYYTDTENGSPHYKDLSITKYREIKIKVQNEDERTYWGFDCDNDGVYMDVICLVREFKNPDPIVKRYMIEDLGSVGDFDFNDIVVDVKDDLQGKQTAYIRAMGGTLNFTIQIGSSTWTKEGSKIMLNGAEVNTEVGTMYNTESPEYNIVLAEFPVSGWVPGDNNITVTVTETGTNKGIQKISFPKMGEVPMIIACDEIVNWMEERESIPGEWWHEPTPEELNAQ